MSLTSGDANHAIEHAVNNHNSTTYDSQNNSQDLNEGTANHFAEKVLNSLEPEIMKDPPSTDRRADTQMTMMDQVSNGKRKSRSRQRSVSSERQAYTVKEERPRARETRGRPPVGPQNNHELFLMDTYYRELMEKERQAFERILKSKINVAERDMERKF